MTVAAYSIETLAQRLDMPVATLKAWRYRGLGPPARVLGRRLRYLDSEVAEWLKNQPIRGHAPPISVQERAKQRRSDSTSGNTAQYADGPVGYTRGLARTDCGGCEASVAVAPMDSRALATLGWVQRSDGWLCTACSYVR